MESRVRYLSSGVNQTPLCFDWSPGGTVCYAADTGLILYEPKSAAVIGASTKVHTKRITSVRWVQSTPSAGTTLVSTGIDGKVVVWVVSEDKIEDFLVLHPHAILDHDDFVLLADATVVIEKDEEQLLVVTVTTDALTTWLVSLHTGKCDRLNSSAPPSKLYIMSLRLFNVEEVKHPILVCGGHDSKIHIMTADKLGIYQSACTLTGHGDWVMTLNLMKEDCGDFLLASGSKDSTVRLWRLSVANTNSQVQITECEDKELKLKSVIFRVGSGVNECTISVLLEAVLAGHEGQVSEVCWAHPLIKDQRKHQPYKLLTCSKTQDRSIIIWQPEGESGGGDGGSSSGESGGGMWLEVARLGEVGGNLEGYYGCQFSPDARQVLGCSYQGGLHLWEECASSWRPCVVVGGHFDQVAYITWEPLGRYLLSASKDQTTRLHARWTDDNGTKSGWHEIGRPQVHGYDLSCITTVGQYSFASGAEEKVIRGFTAPANFIRNFGQICDMDVEDDLARCQVGEGASVPSLGLSNKAVMMADLEEEQQLKAEGREEVQAYFKPLSLSAPPTEDHLMQNTLWPEAAKLYGHGNELMALAATSDGQVLASSCRATNSIDAQIILWDTSCWQKLESLSQHRLTVTHLSFSPDDHFLLGISRDRSWSLFQRQQTDSSALGYTYKLVDFSQRKETMHSRVIWHSAWLPDSSHFFTASRDKTVGVWGQKGEESWVRKATLNESNEVMAVAVIGIDDMKDHMSCVLLATGLVCGAIKVRKFYPRDATFSEDVLQIFHHHHSTVRCLQFKPTHSEPGVSVTLASCGNDKRVMLFEIKVK